MAEPNEQERHEDEQAESAGPNEGEGSHSAAKAYDDAVAETIRRGQVEKKAREAADALDGPEAEELRKAEEEGKKPAREAPSTRH